MSMFKLLIQTLLSSLALALAWSPLLAAAYVGAATLQPEAASKLQLRLEPNFLAVRKGASMHLTLVLHNSSSVPVYYLQTAPDLDYKFIVRDEEGHILAHHSYGTAVLSNRNAVLEAKSERRLAVALDKVVDFHHAGKYTVGASTSLEIVREGGSPSAYATRELLTSNTITVVIGP